MERLTISQYVGSMLLEKGKWQSSHSQMVKEINYKFNLQTIFLLTDIDEATSTVIKLFTTISIIGALYTMYVYGKLILVSSRCFSIC